MDLEDAKSQPKKSRLRLDEIVDVVLLDEKCASHARALSSAAGGGSLGNGVVEGGC
jgi:hypothetical protein